jgi:LysM repeat protein
MRHSFNKPIIILLIVIFILSIAFPAAAQSSWAPTGQGVYTGYVTYVVQPGDRLASIARQFCTTWQEIYYLNYYAIGPDPNNIFPGMVLTVPNQCGGGGSCYDHGPLPHARGYVYGNIYYVLGGDTWFSIGKRFGVPYQYLQSANGTSRLLAGSTIVIPCLNAPPPPTVWPTFTPPPPPFTPTPTPTPTPAPNLPYVYIISPLANAVLPITFEVKGAAWNLDGYNVLVKAIDQQGLVLAQQEVSLQQVDGFQGSSSGQICLQVQGQNEGCIIWNSELSASVQNPNLGAKYWSAQLTVNVAPGTTGRIEVTAPGTNATAVVTPVFFGQGGSGGVDYPPGQCQITIAAGSPAYDQPNGAVVGQFVSAGTLEAQRRELVSGTDWYRVQVQVNSQPRNLWVSSVNLTAIGGGCY